MKNDQAPTHRTVFGWLGRAARWGAAVVVVLTVTGATYQAVASAADRRDYPPPGRLVDVGGFAMHIHCAGEGQPTVILDAGNSGITSTWAWIQPELARETRACSYDRAGLGWCEAGSATRDGVTVARELMALLTAAGETGPYVHVGHSMGGLYGRAFARAYPGQVAGLVLVDASHPEQFDRLPDDLARQIGWYTRMMKLLPLATTLGVTRATNFLGRMADGLPEEDYARAVAMTARPGHVRTGNAEIAAWDAIAEQLPAANGLGDLPLAVVTAGVAPGAPEGFIAAHHENQRELAALSSASVHEILDEADHLSVLTRRDHALATADLILDLVLSVREGSGP
jgi:pimeloyl-ACP methyl ester carboxylesterase